MIASPFPSVWHTLAGGAPNHYDDDDDVGNDDDDDTNIEDNANYDDDPIQLQMMLQPCICQPLNR